MNTRGAEKRIAEFAGQPLLWRLPLLVLLLVGMGSLHYLDTLLRREYATEATTQAVQTDALLESFIRHRVSLLNVERALIATAETPRESRDRFSVLGREMLVDAPDLFAIYLLDATGAVIDIVRRPSDQIAAVDNHFSIPDRAVALSQAREEQRPVATRSLVLLSGGRGMLIYTPVMRGNSITGFIGGAFAYQALFNDALAGQLQGHFAYRILDGAGEVIAISPNYPTRVARLVQRDVDIPGGQAWKLEVAIPPFEPLTPRLALWAVGILLLLLTVFLVLREEARARRLAAHSFDLELVSRELLDANVRLEERTEQIIEANRAKSRFLANVSHELRTPLNTIVGYNSLALEGLYGSLPGPLSAAHERIRTSAEHLLGVVDNVLDLSKIEVGRMDVDLQPVSIAAVLDGVCTVVNPIAAAKGIRVDVVLGRDLPRITSDPRHLRQIVLNLATNAIKFTERGSIAMIARRDEANPRELMVIAVEDTGIGIAEEDRERVFEEFEQVRPDGRGDSLQRGTGLGLAIARKLARLLGGDITVTSRVGEGSRFSLTVPIAGPVIVEPEREITSGEVGRDVEGDIAEERGAAPAAAGSGAADATPTGDDSGGNPETIGSAAANGDNSGSLDDRPAAR
jgi:signal transduction histidine kinase